MKKKLFRLFAMMLALSCTLALSACSGGGESSSSDAGSSVTSTVEDTSSISSDAGTSEAGEDASAENSATGMYSSIEDFVNSDEVQSQLDSMNTEEMGVTVSGDGNKLIYTYTFTQDMEGVDMDTLSSSLESAMESQASTFENIAASVAQVVDVENPVVVVTYQDNQGNVIYTREFAPQA